MLLDNNERANRVLFACQKYPRVMEPGAKAGRWNFTQEAKAWLASEGIKTFVQMGDSGDGQLATIRFAKPEHAKEFFNAWRDSNRN